MSRIVTMILAATAGAAAGEGAVTAVDALARSSAMTSIGPDSCRASTGDDIIVCGRRESAYALPLYEPTVSDDGVTGRERENMTDTMMDVITPCRQRGEVCLTPVPVLRIQSGRGAKSSPVVGPD